MRKSRWATITLGLMLAAPLPYQAGCGTLDELSDLVEDIGDDVEDALDDIDDDDDDLEDFFDDLFDD